MRLLLLLLQLQLLLCPGAHFVGPSAEESLKHQTHASTLHVGSQ
jgi:hypothetical protein